MKSDPVFVKTVHHYDSYTDFWKLVELAHFPTCTTESFDLACPATYVFTPMNGEFQKLDGFARDSKRAKVVWWYLERPDVGENYAKVPLHIGVRELFDRKPWWVDEVWVSEKTLSNIDGRLRHVVLASDPRLASGGLPQSPRFDIAHMSYVWGRRVPVMQRLESLVRVAPCDWEPRRGNLLRASRSVLEVHQSEAPIGSPLRTALAAAHSLPLLSEMILDPEPLLLGRDILMAWYGDLAESVARWVRGDISIHGKELHKRLCVERTFRGEVEKAVASG